MGICKLCQHDKPLRKSHIIPKFFFNWLKKTSATGVLRSVETPNVPLQDGFKEEMLCGDCEELFSKYETYFSQEFFYPYINEHLDDYMRELKESFTVRYDERLLKFFVSVQWRVMISDKINYLTSNDKFNKLLDKKLLDWSEYLLDKRLDTGQGENHLFLMKNIINAEEKSYTAFPPNVINYMLRPSDGTIVYDNNRIFMYSKFGPFMFISLIYPLKSKLLVGTKIGKKGVLSSNQKFNDCDMNQFLFVNRPHKVNKLTQFSDNQRRKIDARWDKDKDRSLNSLTLKIAKSDKDFQERNC